MKPKSIALLAGSAVFLFVASIFFFLWVKHGLSTKPPYLRPKGAALQLDKAAPAARPAETAPAEGVSGGAAPELTPVAPAHVSTVATSRRVEATAATTAPAVPASPARPAPVPAAMPAVPKPVARVDTEVPVTATPGAAAEKVAAVPETIPPPSSPAVAREDTSAPSPTAKAGTNTVKHGHPAGERVDYVVRPGDTLSEIARRHGTRVREIMRWNALQSGRIRTGQKLRLYVSKPVQPLAAKSRGATNICQK